jgi:hypothetical protein
VGEPKTKESTKGNIKMMSAIGWNIKQLDEKCPKSSYVDERERESSCVCEVECNQGSNHYTKLQIISRASGRDKINIREGEGLYII